MQRRRAQRLGRREPDRAVRLELLDEHVARRIRHPGVGAGQDGHASLAERAGDARSRLQPFDRRPAVRICLPTGSSITRGGSEGARDGGSDNDPVGTYSGQQLARNRHCTVGLHETRVLDHVDARLECGFDRRPGMTMRRDGQAIGVPCLYRRGEHVGRELDGVRPRSGRESTP